jgi:hypothetical protein
MACHVDHEMYVGRVSRNNIPVLSILHIHGSSVGNFCPMDTLSQVFFVQICMSRLTAQILYIVSQKS